MTFKLGMVGPGGIANSKLAPAIAEIDDVELWSVLSRDASRAAEFAKRHDARSSTPVYTDLDAMLSDPDLDGVVIATPDKLHSSQTVAAAAAGKHVLVEKPMATDLEGGRAMVDACSKAGVTLAVAYHLRHHAGLRAIHELARNGRFGRLHHMRAQWTFHAADASNWRASTDVGRWWGLGGVGTHSLDQILWFLEPGGGPVAEVSSVISRSVHGGPHDETASIGLRFENGATAELMSSVLIEAPSRFELYGSEGRAVGDGVLSVTGGGTLWLDDEPFDYTPVNPYAGEIRDFVRAARSGEPPAAPGEVGLRNIEVLLEAAPLG